MIGLSAKGTRKMRKVIISAVIASVALFSGVAHAKKETQVTRTIWELSDFPDLEKKAQAICENEKAVKSPRLVKACTDKAFPRVTKAGAFYNPGYGAELNALIRQQ